MIGRIRKVQTVVSWERMKYSNGECGGITFGVNVYQCVHTDQDFTYSVIQVHAILFATFVSKDWELLLH
jgi:hypothetical protein